jgi:hypothetical protein
LTVVRNIEMRIPSGVPPPNYHVRCSMSRTFRKELTFLADYDHSSQGTTHDHISSSPVGLDVVIYPLSMIDINNINNEWSRVGVRQCRTM